jgi:hypothetical protein
LPPPPLLLLQTFDRFKFNCIFDLPLFFCRGADRMRVLSNLVAVPFDKVTAEPKLVSVQMLNNRCGAMQRSAAAVLRLVLMQSGFVLLLWS